MVSTIASWPLWMLPRSLRCTTCAAFIFVFVTPFFGQNTANAGEILFTAVTFNTGTTSVLDHDADPLDGYTSVEATLSDDYYGNGLAWQPAIDAAAAYLALESPEIVAFQEVFDVEECPTIPLSAWPGFVCETWSPAGPSVPELILGANYQIACHQGRRDKCVAVRNDFASFEGCSDPVCFDHLDGVPIPGCGGGARVGRGRLLLANGGVLTVAHVHGSSGITSGDMGCREEQFDQLFSDLDGAPAADGNYNLVLGDFNTDPVRLLIFDSSAQRLVSYVGAPQSFEFISDSGSLDPPSYLDFVTFDHVVSDSLTGNCSVPGLTPGVPPVFETTYFDHKPVSCVPEPQMPMALLIGAAATFFRGASGRRRRWAVSFESNSGARSGLAQNRYVPPSPIAP